MKVQCKIRSGLSTGLLVATCLAITGCRQEVRFTDIPPVGNSDKKTEAPLTNVFVGIPVTLDRLQAAADSAIPQKFRKFVDWLDEAACFERRGVERCFDARASLYLKRDGAVRIAGKGEALRIEIPLTYKLSARGLRGARRIRGGNTGQLTAIARINVRLGANLQPEAYLARKIGWSISSLPVLNGRFDVTASASGRIRRMLRKAVEVFEEDLAGSPIRASTAKAWKALHRPIKIQSEADAWLVNLPKHIYDGGFTTDSGRLLYRVAIAAQMRVVRGIEPDLVFERPMPRASRKGGPGAGSVLRVPVKISYGAVREALKVTWPGPIIARSSNPENEMRITVNSSEIYPSRGLVALGLDLDVETPRRAFDLTGKAYLTARPVLDGKTQLLQLQDVKLAKPIAIPGVGAGTGQRFRLRAAPFVDGFSNALRIDVSRDLNEVMTNANGWFNRSIGSDLRLKGHFSSMTIAGVYPGMDGFRADVDLSGELLITSVDKQVQTGATLASTRTE